MLTLRSMKNAKWWVTRLHSSKEKTHLIRKRPTHLFTIRAYTVVALLPVKLLSILRKRTLVSARRNRTRIAIIRYRSPMNTRERGNLAKGTL